MIEHPNYSFKNIIGHGGMATVYLAEHKTLHQHVAIKVLNKEFVHNENIRKRFLAEARNIFKMSHPHIIKVTDLIDQDDLVAFVMEYMDGQTLKEYLDKKGKLQNEEIKQLFVQMVDVVGYVHEQGLIHRDIKPSNFMISGKGVIKLLDFGIAKNTDSSSAEYTMTGTAQNMGTPMYMSPEQVRSTKDVTAQSDIYSLGVVLWQMVMGRKPYDTNTLSTFELQTKIVTEKLAETNSVFEKVIGKATIKDLINRYKSCSSMKEDLINGLTDSTLTENKIVNEYQAEKTIIASSPIEETKIETAPPKKVNDAANDEENVVSLPQKAESIPVKRKVSPIYFIVGAIAIVLVLFLIANNKSTKAPDMRNDISNSTIDPKVAFLLKNQNKAGVVTLPSGLQYEIKKDGKGPKPTQESEVKVYYHGTTIDGEVLDTGIDWPQPPSTFPVNRVISGWNEALQLMQVGSKWKLYIPAALAYGEKGYQDVKPNATVIYEVELIEIVQ